MMTMHVFIFIHREERLSRRYPFHQDARLFFIRWLGGLYIYYLRVNFALQPFGFALISSAFNNLSTRFPVSLIKSLVLWLTKRNYSYDITGTRKYRNTLYYSGITLAAW